MQSKQASTNAQGAQTVQDAQDGQATANAHDAQTIQGKQAYRDESIIAGAHYSPDWEDGETEREDKTESESRPKVSNVREKMVRKNKSDAQEQTHAGADRKVDANPDAQTQEIKHLTNREKKNIIIGLAILLAVGTALVRFLTY